MNTQIVVKKLSNDTKSAIETMKAGNIFVCRLVNWNLIISKINNDKTNCTIVYYDPLNMDYLDQKIDEKDFQIVYEQTFTHVVSECFYVMDGGEVKTVDDCERIMAALPVPEKRADHEKVRKFMEEYCLEHDLHIGRK